MTVPVTVHTPGAATADPDTGNPIPGAPTSVDTVALLVPYGPSDAEQTSDVAAAADVTAYMPDDTVMSADSTVTAHAKKWNVVGPPIVMRSPFNPMAYMQANLRYVSDIQT